MSAKLAAHEHKARACMKEMLRSVQELSRSSDQYGPLIPLNNVSHTI